MPDRRRISSGTTLEALAGFSRAIVDEPYVHVSSTNGFDFTRQLLSEDVSEQAHQAIRNVRKVLEQVGASLDEVVRVRYYLTEANDFEKLGPIFGEYFAKSKPAATALVVGLTDPRVKIEIEVTARKR